MGILNKHFISIKVDREERPDIDSVCMSACQAFTGSGGWPMSIFMTWDKKPFFAGTYFPPHSRYGMPGFPELLNTIISKWNSSQKNFKSDYASWRDKSVDVSNERVKNIDSILDVEGVDRVFIGPNDLPADMIVSLIKMHLYCDKNPFRGCKFSRTDK